MSARHGADHAVHEETAVSERYIAARSEAEASRLRREREERRAGSAVRDRSEARGLCRYLDDDLYAIQACEDSASAVYERALAARRYAAEAARYAAAAQARARSALMDSELVASRAKDRQANAACACLVLASFEVERRPDLRAHPRGPCPAG